MKFKKGAPSRTKTMQNVVQRVEIFVFPCAFYFKKQTYLKPLPFLFVPLRYFFMLRMLSGNAVTGRGILSTQ